MKLGFDNDKYLQLQSEKIRERIDRFGGKLYLEFGGKLFDDFHAARVLPGFAPDSKINMLVQLKDTAEIVIVINAADIEQNKVRGDLGITYDLDVLRLIDAFRGKGLYVGSVVLTRYSDQPSAAAFEKKLENLGIRTYRHYSIAGYPPIRSASSARRALAATITSRPAAAWWWSPPPAPAAARWPPACPSCSTMTSTASRAATPSLRPSPSGICPCCTRSIWPTRPPLPP